MCFCTGETRLMEADPQLFDECYLVDSSARWLELYPFQSIASCWRNNKYIHNVCVIVIFWKHILGAKHIWYTSCQRMKLTNRSKKRAWGCADFCWSCHLWTRFHSGMDEKFFIGADVFNASSICFCLLLVDNPSEKITSLKNRTSF